MSDGTEKPTYRETMGAEMSPDIYDGPNCDQMRPRWKAWAEGDMDSDYTDDFECSAKHFPPGTRILVMEPECPRCHEIASMCRDNKYCDFNWDFWTECQYQ